MNQKGNIDERLVQAYQQSEYRLIWPEIQIFLEQTNAELDTLLIDNNCFEACLITAYNPRSERLNDHENQKRQGELLDWLKAENYRWIKGKSIDPNGDWPEEEQLLILGMRKKVGGDLARLYEQNAFVYLVIGQITELVLEKDQSVLD